MTIKKVFIRNRRAGGGVGPLPDDVRAWFAGEGFDCWTRLLWPKKLPALWALYVADNPGAKPPSGYEWLNDTTEGKPNNARTKKPRSPD